MNKSTNNDFLAVETVREQPMVAVMANSGIDGDIPVQAVDEKYLQAAISAVGATPLIVPTHLSEIHLDQILELVDGIILTGDASNIDPVLYGIDGTLESHGPFDANRDNASLWIINEAFRKDIPVLGICRGMQEMNVALGGTLRTDVYQNQEFSNHQKIDSNLPFDKRYQHAHEISVNSEGLLGSILGKETTRVNSLHEQAVDKLGDGLVVNACSEDGLVEALHHPDKNFFLGLQWHAEYNVALDDTSKAVFAAFGRAVRAFKYHSVTVE